MNSNAFGSVIENAIREGINNQPKETYIGEDGLKHCSTCGEPVEKDMSAWRMGIVPVLCECGKAKYAAEDAERKKRKRENRIEELREHGFTDGRYLEYTFERDDVRCKAASDYARCYVDSWDEMRDSGNGILLYGNCGTGKTFYACCIANALIEKGIPVLVTNIPQILSLPRERMGEFNDKIQNYPLVVIDDLGAERNTDYAAEEVFRIIDMRSRSGLPLIVTTNLDLETIRNDAAICSGRGRTYDRILGMCPVKLHVGGESRRQQMAEEARERELDRLKRWRSEHAQRTGGINS